MALAAFFVLLALASPAEAAPSVGDTVDAFSQYYGIARSYVDNSDEAYNAFKDTSLAVKVPFYMIAFLIFVIGMVMRVESSKGSGAERTSNVFSSVVKTFVLVGLAASSVMLVELVRDSGVALGEAVAGGGNAAHTQQWQVMFGELAEMTRSIQAEVTWGNIMGALWLAIKVLVVMIDAIAIILADVVVVVGQLLAACVLGGSIMLMPVFLAMLSIPALSRPAVSFLTGIVAVALWPFGWALVTFILTVPLKAVTQGQLAKVLEDVMGQAGQGDLAEVAKLLCFIIFPLIVFVLNFGAPMLINRMVTTGGNAISGAMGKAALAPVQAATAGAGIAAGAAVMAATGGAGAGMAGAAATAGLGKAAQMGGGGAANSIAGATDSSRAAGREAAV